MTQAAEADNPPTENNDGFLHKDTNNCYFCGDRLKRDKWGEYTEEVGEFWSKKHQDSVLGHPDCTPRGIEAIQMGEDPDWAMA